MAHEKLTRTIADVDEQVLLCRSFGHRPRLLSRRTLVMLGNTDTKYQYVVRMCDCNVIWRDLYDSTGHKIRSASKMAYPSGYLLHGVQERPGKAGAIVEMMHRAVVEGTVYSIRSLDDLEDE